MPVIDPVLLHSILLSVAATALMIAAFYDLAVRIIPNGLSLIVAFSGFGLNGLENQLGPALLSGGLVLAGAWQCWRRGWIGGGDVKLLTACALLVRPQTVPELIVTTALAGAVLALCYLALGPLLPANASPRPRGKLARIWRTERRRIARGSSLPYAWAIAAGVVLTLCSPYPPASDDIVRFARSSDLHRPVNRPVAPIVSQGAAPGQQ